MRREIFRNGRWLSVETETGEVITASRVKPKPPRPAIQLDLFTLEPGAPTATAIAGYELAFRRNQ